MEIVNLSGDKINACFRFKRKNCEISISTIMNRDRPEIAIFYGNDEHRVEQTIDDAIYWVDNLSDIEHCNQGVCK